MKTKFSIGDIVTSIVASNATFRIDTIDTGGDPILYSGTIITGPNAGLRNVENEDDLLLISSIAAQGMFRYTEPEQNKEQPLEHCFHDYENYESFTQIIEACRFCGKRK